MKAQHHDVNHVTRVFCSSIRRDKLQPQPRVTLRDLQKSSTNSTPAPNATTNSSGPAPALGTTSSLVVQSGLPDTLLLSNLSLTAADPCDNISLADVSVPLESIKPSKHKQWHWLLSYSICAILSLFLYITFFLCFLFTLQIYSRQLITSDYI